MKEIELHKKITDHLEFLGYEIEDLEVKEGFTYIATSDNRPLLVVRIFKNTTILSSRYKGYQLRALKSKDFFETINKINQVVLSKWYCENTDDDVIIVIEDDYYGYEKSSFGTLVDTFLTDIQTNIALFSKFLREE